LVESARSEDALAGIIAHELAHIQLRHGMRLIEAMRPFSEMDEIAQQARDFARRGSAAGQAAAERAAALHDSVSGMLDALIKNGNSQEQEFEADATAIGLLAAAGYDPEGLREMLEVLRRVQGSHSGGFNSTHPSPARRIANISDIQSGESRGGPETRSAREARFKRFFGAGE
jgi:predicted Zn-dependent protease